MISVYFIFQLLHSELNNARDFISRELRHLQMCQPLPTGHGSGGSTGHHLRPDPEANSYRLPREV